MLHLRRQSKFRGRLKTAGLSFIMCCCMMNPAEGAIATGLGYDSNGNLMPNQFAAFGGSLLSCGTGETRKPRSERSLVPAAWRAWVEQREACEKAVADNKHSTKEAFDACRATAEASRPKTPAPKDK